MSGSGPQDEKPQIELSSDDDWKSRVKEEDAKRDAEAAQTPVQSEPEADDDSEPTFDSSQLPPPSLVSLMQMLSSQSIVAMGLIPSPTGKSTVQLPLAKHFIDLLGVLEVKCKGNLAEEEQKFLDGTLHELRMAYVEMSKKSR